MMLLTCVLVPGKSLEFFIYIVLMEMRCRSREKGPHSGSLKVSWVGGLGSKVLHFY